MLICFLQPSSKSALLFNFASFAVAIVCEQLQLTSRWLWCCMSSGDLLPFVYKKKDTKQKKKQNKTMHNAIFIKQRLQNCWVSLYNMLFMLFNIPLHVAIFPLPLYEPLLIGCKPLTLVVPGMFIIRWHLCWQLTLPASS